MNIRPNRNRPVFIWAVFCGVRVQKKRNDESEEVEREVNQAIEDF